jgi:protein arginine N-methyltransferase 5
MDNLESQTYETFEKDAIKYEKYHEAVYKYMLDQQADKQIVAMVVGAGRGPLVRAILRAAAESHRIVKIFAVEKNPNALVTLRNMKVSLNWGDKVTIVDSDMRYTSITFICI